MTDRMGEPDPNGRSSAADDMPPPDVAAFIRYCHRRRGVGWPELYDEMCGVAARAEFNGWSHAELAARGVSFSLFDMARLSTWVRAVLATERPITNEPATFGGAPLEAGALA